MTEIESDYKEEIKALKTLDNFCRNNECEYCPIRIRCSQFFGDNTMTLATASLIHEFEKAELL